MIGYDDSFKNYLTYVIKYLNNDRKKLCREFFDQNYEYEKLLRQWKKQNKLMFGLI